MWMILMVNWDQFSVNMYIYILRNMYIYIFIFLYIIYIYIHFLMYFLICIILYIYNSNTFWSARGPAIPYIQDGQFFIGCELKTPPTRSPAVIEVGQTADAGDAKKNPMEVPQTRNSPLLEVEEPKENIKEIFRWGVEVGSLYTIIFTTGFDTSKWWLGMGALYFWGDLSDEHFFERKWIEIIIWGVNKNPKIVSPLIP